MATRIRARIQNLTKPLTDPKKGQQLLIYRTLYDYYRSEPCRLRDTAMNAVVWAVSP